MEFDYFQLSLVHTSTMIFQVAEPPTLLLAAHGTILPDTIHPRARDARGADACGAIFWAARVVLREATVTGTVVLSRANVEQVMLRLRELGVTDREPQIDGVVDTSDCHATTDLVGRCSLPSGQPFPFRIHLSQMASGYRGASARAFAELCRTLLLLGGFAQQDSPVWDDLVHGARV